MEHLWCKKSPGQEAVSVMSPSQASAEEVTMQLRDLNSIDLVASHPDHSPHSAQVPAAPAERKMREQIYNFLWVCVGARIIWGTFI